MRCYLRPIAARLAGSAIALTLALPAVGSAGPAPTATDTVALDALVQREHAAGRFDGVLLVGRGDEVVHRRAIGWADRERQQPHHVDEAWRWASVSKQVTALLTMQLVERGRLSLDDRLAKLLPPFTAAHAAHISIRDLLRHTSGLPNPDYTASAAGSDPTMPAFYTRSFSDDQGPIDAALVTCAGPALAAPGERFAYNNCDTLVLQAVLEHATGKPYAQLLADEVAAPLGLAQLQFASPASRAVATPVGTMADGSVEPAFNLATFGAGGAIVGTADALWRFDRALMQGRLLGAEATRTMWQGDPKLGYVALGAWSFPARLAGCSAPVALVERRGEIGGVQVRNLMAPALHTALVVFSNTGATEFGEIWQGRGLSFELASAAFCGAAPPK